VLGLESVTYAKLKLETACNSVLCSAVVQEGLVYTKDNADTGNLCTDTTADEEVETVACRIVTTEVVGRSAAGAAVRGECALVYKAELEGGACVCEHVGVTGEIETESGVDRNIDSDVSSLVGTCTITEKTVIVLAAKEEVCIYTGVYAKAAHCGDGHIILCTYIETIQRSLSGSLGVVRSCVNRLFICIYVAGTSAQLGICIECNEHH